MLYDEKGTRLALLAALLPCRLGNTIPGTPAGPQIEPFAHGLIRGKAVELGAVVFALNGMDDHVHLVVSIPPKLAPAIFIGKVKGASSARLSQSGRLDQLFYWQEEYAVFSLDAKRLPHHVAYVDNQKIHHARATVIPALERTGEDQKPL